MSGARHGEQGAMQGLRGRGLSPPQAMGTDPCPRTCCPLPQSMLSPGAVSLAVPSGRLVHGSPTQLVCKQQGEVLEVFLQVSSSGIPWKKALPVSDVSLSNPRLFAFFGLKHRRNKRIEAKGCPDEPVPTICTALAAVPRAVPSALSLQGGTDFVPLEHQ